MIFDFSPFRIGRGGIATGKESEYTNILFALCEKSLQRKGTIPLILHVLEHAFFDTAKMLPFLFIAYLVIEYIEVKHGSWVEKALAGGGHWGFVPGALLGCVPQCGFSAMAADFYGSRVITLGTMMAVFLATSDEAIPLLLAVPDQWPRLVSLIVLKVLIGLAAGFLLDFALHRFLPKSLCGGYTGKASEVDCHEEHEEKAGIVMPALHHTLNIFLWVLLFSFGIGLVMELVGESVFTGFLAAMGPLQPVVAALVGLVPNCAASVLLTQLYLSGSISFASAVAGLCSGAGVGLVVLFKTNPSIKQNLFITGLLWAFGSAAGILLQLFGL